MKSIPIKACIVIVAGVIAIACKNQSGGNRTDDPADVEGSAITVGPTVRVSTDRDGYSHSEPTAAADPTNPSRLATCMMLRPEPATDNGADLRTVLYLSEDGGKSWHVAVEDSVQMPADLKLRRLARLPFHSWDATCAFSADGALYFAAGNYVGPRFKHDARTRFYRSMDGGRTWSAGLFDLDYYDKPWLAIDQHEGSPYRGRIYLAYNDKKDSTTIVSSTDGGASFGSPARIGFVENTGKWGKANIGINPFGSTVLSDGTVLFMNNGYMILTALTSRDGGKTFSVSKISNPLKMYGFDPAGSVASDGSHGAFHDRIYVAWAGLSQGYERQSIVAAFSSDGGKTWSAPRTIVERAPGDTANLLMPEVAVNKDGVVGISWYVNTGFNHRVFFSASLDGGDTWLSPVEVTKGIRSDSVKPQVLAGYVTGGGTQESNGPPPTPGSLISGSVGPQMRWIGHYAGITATADGAFHPVWIDGARGEPYTTSIRVAGKVTKYGDASLTGYQDVTNKTTIRLLGFSYDAKSKVSSGELYLENTSNDTLRGPIVARLVSLSSDRGPVSIEGAAKQGVIDLTTALGGTNGVLPPGSTSDAIQLRFVVRDTVTKKALQFSPSIKFDARILQGRN
jgi:hypothetical protein